MCKNIDTRGCIYVHRVAKSLHDDGLVALLFCRLALVMCRCRVAEDECRSVKPLLFVWMIHLGFNP